MAVWTISAELGTGGRNLAAGLAAAAGVPLLDRKALFALAHDELDELGDADELEQHVGGRLNALALSVALTAGSVEAYREVRLWQRLPELGRSVLGEAARSPCVIVAPGAFAALRDRPGAVHVRLWAPFERRVAAYQREQVVDHRCAEKAVRHDDHLKRAWVKTLYHVDIDDPRLFSLVADTSRFQPDRLVQAMLAAAGGGAEAAG